MYYAGSDDRNHYNGVAFILDKGIHKSVKFFAPISDQVIVFQLQNDFETLFQNRLRLTCNHSDKAIEVFYKQTALNLTKKSEVTIIMDDFNPKLGCSSLIC